jgi:hypothetical protein
MLPFTVLTIMCFTAKFADACAESTSQLEASAKDDIVNTAEIRVFFIVGVPSSEGAAEQRCFVAAVPESKLSATF